MKKNALEEYIDNWDECHRKLMKHISKIYNLQKDVAAETFPPKKKKLIEKKSERLETAQKETGWVILEGDLNDEKGRLGNKHPSFRYFPEPYYCKNLSEPINLIFVNINPYIGV